MAVFTVTKALFTISVDTFLRKRFPDRKTFLPKKEQCLPSIKVMYQSPKLKNAGQYRRGTPNTAGKTLK